MSSTTYSACLTPDPRLRRVVIGSACVLIAVGLLLILQLPIAAGIRVAAAAVWCGMSYREVQQFRLGYGTCCAIHVLPGGEVKLLNNDQQWVLAELLSGSILLASIGWLRLKTPDGRQFAELLYGDRRQNPQWRRLHVIWRHIGAPD